MFKYTMAAVAMIYCGLLVFGDEARRPEVTKEASDDITGITLASFAVPETRNSLPNLSSGISDADAIALALKAGEVARANRERRALRGSVSSKSKPDDVSETSAQPRNLWFVTGSRVNLRSGPGTGNAVIGQVVWGDAAEVLDDADGWYQIRTADGSVSGWIFGKFLDETQPG